MSFFDKFPYTNFHELNLDWIVSQIKTINVNMMKAIESAKNAKTSEDNAKASADKAKTSETNAKTSETNADDYKNDTETIKNKALEYLQQSAGLYAQLKGTANYFNSGVHAGELSAFKNVECVIRNNTLYIYSDVYPLYGSTQESNVLTKQQSLIVGGSFKLDLQIDNDFSIKEWVDSVLPNVDWDNLTVTDCGVGNAFNKFKYTYDSTAQTSEMGYTPMMGIVQYKRDDGRKYLRYQMTCVFDLDIVSNGKISVEEQHKIYCPVCITIPLKFTDTTDVTPIDLYQPVYYDNHNNIGTRCIASFDGKYLDVYLSKTYRVPTLIVNEPLNGLPSVSAIVPYDSDDITNLNTWISEVTGGKKLTILVNEVDEHGFGISVFDNMVVDAYANTQFNNISTVTSVKIMYVTDTVAKANNLKAAFNSASSLEKSATPRTHYRFLVTE